MARKPTGRPPGRPPKYVSDLKLDRQKAAAMREALEFFNRAQLTLSPSELERIKRMENPVQAAVENDELAKWDDVKVPSDTMVPLKDLVPLTEEELKKASTQARGILGAVVAGFHARVPELLARLATWEPEKALKLYIELMEYQTPKLQRVEQSGSVDHRHQMFVPVESRDSDPRLIEASVVREEDPSVQRPANHETQASGPTDAALDAEYREVLARERVDGVRCGSEGPVQSDRGPTDGDVQASRSSAVEAPPWDDSPDALDSVDAQVSGRDRAG